MEERNIQLEHHLVCFLDVLNQSEKLKKLRLIKSAEDEAEVSELVKRTAGFVILLRETFDKNFSGFENGLTNLKKITEESVRPKYIGFPIRSLLGHHCAVIAK